MRIPPSAQSVPKAGRSPDENEDAYALNAATGRYAVADGVSRSARPEVWSSLLVREYTAGAGSVLQAPKLESLAGRWRELTTTPDLPWYALEKLSQGASATFLGLQIDHASGVYTAETVGDTCLFHVRNSQLLCSHPLTAPDQFTDSPPQVTTTSNARPTYLTGRARAWDQMVLATDAMAKFLLLVHQRRGEFPALIDLVRGNFFQDYVDLHRGLHRLDNDDTTLCVVTV